MRESLMRGMALGVRWAVAGAIVGACPVLVSGQTGTLLRGFHIGLALQAGQVEATMQKSVDNTAPNTLVPEPRRGRVFQDKASGDGAAYGAGVVGGYRVPLSGGAWFVEAEAGVAWHGGSTEAQFAGVGVSPDRRQLGESWPDSWEVSKEISYGATLRLGGSPGGLGSRGMAFHLLAGMRFAAVGFTNHYVGCFSPDPCEPSEFGSGREDMDMDFSVWRGGIGLEKSLGDRLAVRVEADYSMYAREEWVTPFNDVVVTVDSGMEASEVGLSLGLVRRF
ncbi:MAG: hypothetical protein F4087_13475 [Gemmatimonadetes bacterium]|nr:hypothetical protein [Gemmatimonadota bacterium]MYE70653.1 hypothetical protein [Gemmatimonadota bacterium]MYJ69499.1 hypothetical protein [Gemmatimonadota bacterium]